MVNFYSSPILFPDLIMGQALGCIVVDQSTVAVKEHFGKFDNVLQPGCHCLPWCLGYQMAGKLSLRVNQLDVRCETKTKVLLHFFFHRPLMVISWMLQNFCFI